MNLFRSALRAAGLALVLCFGCNSTAQAADKYTLEVGYQGFIDYRFYRAAASSHEEKISP